MLVGRTFHGAPIMMIGWCNAETRCTAQLCVYKAAQQKSSALLTHLHCNEHRANDSLNHSLPNLTFGSEIDRSFDRFRHPMIIILPHAARLRKFFFASVGPVRTRTKKHRGRLPKIVHFPAELIVAFCGRLCYIMIYGFLWGVVPKQCGRYADPTSLRLLFFGLRSCFAMA